MKNDQGYRALAVLVASVPSAWTGDRRRTHVVDSSGL